MKTHERKGAVCTTPERSVKDLPIRTNKRKEKKRGHTSF